jgi:HlyD family secretion protein
MYMDIARPDLKARRNRRLVAIGALTVLVAVGLGIDLLRMKPAAATVDVSIYSDVVKRGELLRQVRGPGTLVPREDKIRLIPALTDATVARIRVLPGTRVAPETILMDLVDPTVEQQMLDAQLALKGAKADLENTRAKVNSDLMAMRAEAATVEDDNQTAALQAKTDKSLYDLGVVSGLTASASSGKAQELDKRQQIELEKLEMNRKAVGTQIGVQEAKVQQAEAVLALKQKQKDALEVRAGIDGVLEAPDTPIQAGAHVTAGMTLAKVVQPDQLKAALKISEVQARDIAIDQPAQVDTHNGVVQGKVMRIDPAVVNGTVTVDIELTGSLASTGARPDLSIDGTIDLDRLSNVLYVARPASANENASSSLFRLDPGGKTATRVPVKYGKASVNSIEILSGLKSGDEVILNDLSRWDSENKIKLP